MCAIQMTSAQVRRVTGKGLAGNMRRHYPALVIYPLIALLLMANVINIRAHHRAMAAALRLLVVGPQLAFVAAFAIVTVLLEVFMRYSRYASVLRWRAPSLLAYVATVFAVEVPWLTVAHNLVVPHIKFSGTISQSSWRFLARHQPLSVLAGGRRGRGRERRPEGGPVG
jgi:Mn2+/Fe2+ NRAMP family transporter